jgi:autotransporter-associated beta strand protein
MPTFLPFRVIDPSSPPVLISAHSSHNLTSNASIALDSVGQSQQKNLMKTRLTSKTLILQALLALPMLTHAAEGTSTLTASDASGISAFISKTNWSGGLSPGPGTNFFTSTFGMRTPPDAASYTFGGDSLTLQSGTTSGYSLIEKASGSRTLTVNNFTNAGGLIRSGGNYTFSVTIAGNLFAVSANSTILADQNGWIINSPLVGGDGVVLTNSATTTTHAADTISYSGNNSGYTGTLLLSSGTTKFLAVNSMPGNPSVPNRSQITLTAGVTLEDDAGILLTNANGGITLAGAATISTATAGSNTLVAVPVTGAFALTKSGAGILTLSGSNSFSGGLTLSGATAGSQLNLNSTNALGTGTFTINSGDNAMMDNTSGSVLTLLANNPQSWVNNFTFAGSSDLNFGSGAVSMAASRTVTVNSNNLTVGGVISGSGFSLTKAGAGTLTLTAGNTYTGGTTISAGALLMTNPAALGTGGVTFSGTGNAMLDIATDGSDTAYAVSAGSGAIFTIASDVKTGSVGINHTLGNFSIGSGTTLTMNVTKGTNITSGSPKITTGALTLSGGTGGTTILNPTTADISIASVTSTTSSKTLQLDGTSTGSAITGALGQGGGKHRHGGQVRHRHLDAVWREHLHRHHDRQQRHFGSHRQPWHQHGHGGGRHAGVERQRRDCQPAQNYPCRQREV